MKAEGPLAISSSARTRPGRNGEQTTTDAGDSTERAAVLIVDDDPFSLSAAGNGRWLRLTVKVVGRHTADLRDLTPGTRVWAEGPSGTFTAAHRTRERALLIAGGSGIAPLRAMLEELPPGAALIYRARTPADVLLHNELDWLAQARHTSVWYVVGSRDDPGPRQVMSPEGLRRLVVNAVYWGFDLEVPSRADVRYVDDYKPLMYGFDAYRRGIKASDHAVGKVLPPGKKSGE